MVAKGENRVWCYTYTVSDFSVKMSPGTPKVPKRTPNYSFIGLKSLIHHIKGLAAGVGSKEYLTILKNPVGLLSILYQRGSRRGIS